MSILNQLIASISAFNIQKDEIIQAFSQLENSDVVKRLSAYSNICRVLLRENLSLGAYLHNLLLYSNCPLATIDSHLSSKAISHDVWVIKHLHSYTSDKIKEDFLAEIHGEFLQSLPIFQQGEFDYNGDYFLDKFKTTGGGILAKYQAFRFEKGEIIPITRLDPIRISQLKGYHFQRNQVVENTLAFISNLPASNALLYGDRGTGKSSTIKAILNEYPTLKMVQVEKNEIVNLSKLFTLLESSPSKFIVLFDDLTFTEEDESYNIFKAVLEGSIEVMPENVLIYATTNRRHILKDTVNSRQGEAVNRGDAIDESVSLSERFGLLVTFSHPNKNEYFDIIEKMAKDEEISLPTETLLTGAEKFALKKGGRSPRIARQYIDFVKARTGLNLPLA